MQSGGQPGLAGGGIAEVIGAIGAWNAVGAGFKYTLGTPDGPLRCATQELNNSRVTISFSDPCGEISNFGGTLAIGGSYFETEGGTTVNGVVFGRATEGFVINNDSTVALTYLTSERLLPLRPVARTGSRARARPLDRQHRDHVPQHPVGLFLRCLRPGC